MIAFLFFGEGFEVHMKHIHDPRDGKRHMSIYPTVHSLFLLFLGRGNKYWWCIQKIVLHPVSYLSGLLAPPCFDEN